METNFSTLADIHRMAQAELFELLDQKDKYQIFAQKCQEISKNIVCQARDRRLGFEGRTLLHNATRAGNIDAVMLLASLGHPVNVIDSSTTKVTPLAEAITFNHLDIAVSLTKLGADISYQDIRGENALHHCARLGSTRMISFILNSVDIFVDEIQSLASTGNARLQFPEDLAKNCLTRDMLIELRETGYYKPLHVKLEKRDYF